MSELRYGIWAPVGGNFGPLNTLDEPIDAIVMNARDRSALNLASLAAIFRLHGNLAF